MRCVFATNNYQRPIEVTIKLNSKLWILLLIFIITTCIAQSEDKDNYNVIAKWSKLLVKITQRNILSMDEGKLYSSRLVGLLGPSGSGKSTFLSVISGKIKNNKNGYKCETDIQRICDKDDTNGGVAFIHQDDQFFSMLSVEETLHLASSFRTLDQLYDHSNRTSYLQASVTKVMKSLALHSIAKSYIGDPMKRGISGGERKRLAVASELLGNPSLLLADEPTSGLDSFQAYSIMLHLSTLAKSSDISIICAIHQPRSSIWGLFDDIILLAPGGHVIYFGGREAMIPYFNNIGYSCPVNTNPAEYFIDLVSYNSSSLTTIDESKARIDSLVNHFKQYSSKSKIESSNQLVISPSSSTSTSTPLTKKKGDRKNIFQFIFRSFHQSYRRTSLLLLRSFRQAYRDLPTLGVRFVTSGLLAVIVSSVYGEKTGIRELTKKNIPVRINILGQAVVQVGMMSVIKTLQLLKKEKVVIDRERDSHQYTALEYLLAKSLIELPIDALFATVFGALLHRFTDLQTDPRQLAEILSLYSLACSSFGLAVGSVCPAQSDIALAIGPAITVIYIILGVNIGGKGTKELPTVLKPFKFFSPMRWACEALYSTEFKGRSFSTNRKQSRGPFGVLLSIGPIVKGLFIRDKSGSATTTTGKAVVISSRPRPTDSSKQPLTTTATATTTNALTDGDRVMENLGMQSSSVKHASGMLIKLISVHMIVSLLGLIFQPKSN